MLVNIKRNIAKARLDALKKYDKLTYRGVQNPELEMAIKKMYILDRFVTSWSDDQIKNTERYVRELQSM